MNSLPSCRAGKHGGDQRQQRDRHHPPRMRERGAQHRPVGGDQPAVERVVLFGANVAADEPHHQHRHQGDREPGRGGHRPGLGLGERREQPALLRLQREHRQERERDDQQAEEQRRTDLGGGVGDQLCAGGEVGFGCSGCQCVGGARRSPPLRPPVRGGECRGASVRGACGRFRSSRLPRRAWRRWRSRCRRAT